MGFELSDAEALYTYEGERGGESEEMSPFYC